MILKTGLAGIAAISILVPDRALAQSRQTDFTLSYHARETINLRDNDILRLRYGVEEPGIAGASRLVFFGGFRDVGIDLFSDSDSVSFDQLDLGIEAVWMQDRGDYRHGFGARVNYAEDHETSAELAYIYEHFGQSVDFRVVGGLQAVTGSVPGRDDFRPFGIAEATWWLSDNFLLRAGLQADSDGEIASFGMETGLGQGRYSFYLDFGGALNGYRGISEYNDVSGGIRIALGGGSLRKTLRERHVRSFARSVEVQ